MTDNIERQEERDDSKDIVTIDYYDRINKRWLKLDVTKEVARLLYREDKQTRRNNNRYKFHNLPFDEVFDSRHEENQKYLIDEKADFDYEENEELKDVEIESHRTMVENALFCLTTEQREVFELNFYNNMTYREIGEQLDLDEDTVRMRIKRAKNRIKKFIFDNQN